MFTQSSNIKISARLTTKQNREPWEVHEENIQVVKQSNDVECVSTALFWEENKVK